MSARNVAKGLGDEKGMLCSAIKARKGKEIGKGEAPEVQANVCCVVPVFTGTQEDDFRKSSRVLFTARRRSNAGNQSRRWHRLKVQAMKRRLEVAKLIPSRTIRASQVDVVVEVTRSISSQGLPSKQSRTRCRNVSVPDECTMRKLGNADSRRTTAYHCTSDASTSLARSLHALCSTVESWKVARAALCAVALRGK